MAIYVLGLDPGTHKMGVGLYQLADGRTAPRLLDCFPLCAPHGGDFDYADERCRWMRLELQTRLEQDHGLLAGSPVEVAAEHLTGHAINPNAVLDAGIIMLRQWATRRGWTWQEYSPVQWRAVAQIAGMAAKTKAEVQHVMERRFPALRALHDAAGGLDAIEGAAIGLHHAERRRIELGSAALLTQKSMRAEVE